MRPDPRSYTQYARIHTNRSSFKTPISILVTATVSRLSKHTCSLHEINAGQIVCYIAYGQWPAITDFRDIEIIPEEK